ncbi:hypothetical protein RUM44_007055 [Polyplax serrata]|uniref:Uncharacterized protein n=1 Tax=Polyplax serrata TaxID=468196 RepID=A0ABR1AZN8_POLSC
MCEVRDDSFACESQSSAPLDLEKKCVPTQTQVREQLGSKLSDVFFESLCTEGRTWLGLQPPLVGPDALWINPDSRVRGKVTSTPVPEPSVLHLKALTHGSILDVGQQCVIKFENKYRMELERALLNQAEELEDEFRRKLGDTGSSGVEGLGQCKKVVATLMEHFEKCFDDLVETTNLQMRKECSLRVEKERAEISAYMLTQLQDEMARRDFVLCNDFHDILYNELNALAAKYVQQIDNERLIATELLKETVAKYEKIILDQKTRMEMDAVIDICQAINQERIECNDRMRKLRGDGREKVNALLSVIDELKKENCTLQKMSTERLKRLMLWREKVHVLLQEFQRFVNFAMESVPGQSEFMLSIEKLMFKKFPEDSFINPEDYRHYKDCMKDRIDACREEYRPEPEDVESVETLVVESVAEGEGEGEEQSESYDDVCYRENLGRKRECNLNFDYDKYKEMLVQRFAFDVEKPTPKKHPKKKMVCLWKQKSKGISIDRSNEWMFPHLKIRNSNLENLDRFGTKNGR